MKSFGEHYGDFRKRQLSKRLAVNCQLPELELKDPEVKLLMIR